MPREIRTFATNGTAKIVKSFLARCDKSQSSYLVLSRGVFWAPAERLSKFYIPMKKFLFLGAFAFFALTVSAQSTEAPAEKKAKTEQTCAKDANKTSCSKDEKASCDKSKSNGSCCSKSAGASAQPDGKATSSCSKDKSATGSCCSKSAGASASTDSKSGSCEKSATSGCCAKGASADTDDKKKSKKKGNKTSGLSGSN